MDVARRIRFSSDADNVRLTNVCIIIIIIITQFVNELWKFSEQRDVSLGTNHWILVLTDPDFDLDLWILMELWDRDIYK